MSQNTEANWIQCTACSNDRGADTKVPGVYQCTRCEGLIGMTTLGSAYQLVLVHSWHAGEARPEDTRYFDLELISSKGVSRMHGWYHVGSRGVVQVG